jgi:hypothetical protein
MGRPAVTSFIVVEEHFVLKFEMGGGVWQFKPLMLSALNILVDNAAPVSFGVETDFPGV